VLYGFGAYGQFPWGSYVASSSSLLLAANAASFTLSAVLETLVLSEQAAGGAYVVAGLSVTFAEAELANAGIYSLSGNSEAFKDGLAAASGAYALNGLAPSDSISASHSPALRLPMGSRSLRSGALMA
jgi:hypothetical protein